MGIHWSILFVVFQFYLLEAGYNATLIGFVGFVRNLVSTIFMIPAGFIGDYYGRKKVSLLGLTLILIGLALIAYSPLFTIVIISSISIGIGQALIFPSLTALFADTLGSKEEMDFAFSLQSLTFSLAFAFGSALGWLPEILAKFVGIMLAYQITITLGVFLVFLSILPIIFVRAREPRVRTRFQLRLKSRRIVVKFSILYLIIGVAEGLSIALFPTYFNRKFMVSTGEMGTLQALAYLLSSFAFLFAPRLAKMIGSVKAITYLEGFSALALILIPISPSFFISSFPFIIRQILVMMSYPLMTALMMRLAVAEERASVISLSNFFWSITFSITQPIGGYMIDYIWVDMPLIITSIFYLAYALGFYILFLRE
jgi:MFS family permease